MMQQKQAYYFPPESLQT